MFQDAPDDTPLLDEGNEAIRLPEDHDAGHSAMRISFLIGSVTGKWRRFVDESPPFCHYNDVLLNLKNVDLLEIIRILAPGNYLIPAKDKQPVAAVLI